MLHGGQRKLRFIDLQEEGVAPFRQRQRDGGTQNDAALEDVVDPVLVQTGNHRRRRTEQMHHFLEVARVPVVTDVQVRQIEQRGRVDAGIIVAGADELKWDVVERLAVGLLGRDRSAHLGERARLILAV